MSEEHASHCVICGTQLLPGAKSCTVCGLAVGAEPLPRRAIARPEVSQEAMRGGEDGVVLGIKWLKFWNYAVLPAVGVVALLLAFQMPGLQYGVVPIGMLSIAVAYGLRKRQLWAWQWNWVVVAVICLAMLVPVPIREIHVGFIDYGARALNELLSIDWTQPRDFVVSVAIRLILVSFLWILPNWLYWKKRERLFS
jgi:hypothetical protein